MENNQSHRRISVYDSGMDTPESLREILGDDPAATSEAAAFFLVEMALSGLIKTHGPERARQLLHQWVDEAQRLAVPVSVSFRRNA